MLYADLEVFMRYMILLLVLAACGMNEYRPEVAEPKDAKYEQDVKDCIQYSKDVRSKPDGRNVIMGATGLVGYAALEITKDKNDPYYKNGYEIVDDCMKSRGYTFK
jgi:hypothetical protein